MDFFFSNHLPNYFFNSFILLAFTTSCGHEFHNLIMCYVNKYFLLTLDTLRILYLYFFFFFFFFFADAYAAGADCLETCLCVLWIWNCPFDVGISKHTDYKLHINVDCILIHTRNTFLDQLFFCLPECSLWLSFRDCGSLINFWGLIFY